MRGTRIGALAGVGFVLVRVVELALTGGPTPERRPRAPAGGRLLDHRHDDLTCLTGDEW